MLTLKKNFENISKSILKREKVEKKITKGFKTIPMSLN